jgi:hypothetical protein
MGFAERPASHSADKIKKFRTLDRPELFYVLIAMQIFFASACYLMKNESTINIAKNVPAKMPMRVRSRLT